MNAKLIMTITIVCGMISKNSEGPLRTNLNQDTDKKLFFYHAKMSVK